MSAEEGTVATATTEKVSNCTAGIAGAQTNEDSTVATTATATTTITTNSPKLSTASAANATTTANAATSNSGDSAETKTQTRFNFYNAAEVHTATSDVVVANGSKPIAKEPTRFHFYNPEEIHKTAPLHLPTPIDLTQKAALGGIPLPTTAATAEKEKEASPVRSTEMSSPAKKSPSKSSKQKQKQKQQQQQHQESSNSNQGSGNEANEILRSLQETEREQQQLHATTSPTQQQQNQSKKKGARRGRNQLAAAIPSSTSNAGSATSNGSSNNPYEAAIHDALALLRHTKQPNDDKILESREATYSEVREADTKARDERLAKYAAKLVDSHTRPMPPLSPEHHTDHGVLPKVDKEQVEELFRARVEDDVDIISLQQERQPSDDEQHAILQQSSSRNVDEEVQKGVERVLMAILDNADHSTGGDVPCDSLSKALSFLTGDIVAPPSAHIPPRVKPPSRRVAEEYLTDDEGETDDDNDLETDNDDDDGANAQATDEVDESLASTNKRSVVDELLAEDEQQQAAATVVMTGGANKERSSVDPPPSTTLEMPTSPQSIYSKLTTEASSQVETQGSGSVVVGDDDDDGGNDVIIDDDMLNQSHSLTQVLGPLSGNDTTGVVLESSDTVDADDELEVDDLDVEDDTKSEAQSSIMESLSTAVKDAESFMSFMTGGATSPTTTEVESTIVTKKDKYLVQKDAAMDDDDDDEEEVSLDAEANELMRSLCAHLLPYGVDKSTKHLSEIPPWDDRNPNEPGYRIIRLSKSQLKRVEREFERMVNGVKRSSERDLVSAGNKGLTAKDARNDWNGVAAVDDDDVDQRFEKDLEEAEDLLEREEQLRATTEKVKKLSDASSSDDDDDEDEETTESIVTDDEENILLDSHPDFPGIRRSGKGEMGDLEYFSLPIIFKSHVTGFEPTKDLYLEPGNVVAGQYLVENELGSAAFSTAYRCIDLNSDASGNGDFHEEVCLKVIKNTKDFFDQSLDEIKILELLRQTGKCNQHNIVEMKTFFYHREHLVIVTELLRQNLFEFGKFIIDNNEEPYFTRRRLCYLTRQVLQALKFVHNLGLVHSDIKPENILLSSYSRAKVKVIDFGSSCYLTDRQSSYIQSRSYRAPEVVLGLPYDGKIDVWSLGCVVAEMYTGEVTFQNDSIVSMLSRIEAICGPFPRHMIAQGRQSNRFFTKSGLLYELVEPDERRTNPVQDDDEAGLFDVFQPKRTTMASRLGYDPQALQQPSTPEDQDQALFVDFCRSVLTIDPDSRPTAAQALNHPWIVSGESLTEEDIKYPSN